jgi:hypothetical protein
MKLWYSSNECVNTYTMRYSRTSTPPVYRSSKYNIARKHIPWIICSVIQIYVYLCCERKHKIWIPCTLYINAARMCQQHRHYVLLTYLTFIPCVSNWTEAGLCTVIDSTITAVLTLLVRPRTRSYRITHILTLLHRFTYTYQTVCNPLKDTVRINRVLPFNQ